MSSASSPYQAYSTERIKHLDMIQAVITRLGGNSFVVKGWAATVVGALLGLAVNNGDDGLAYVTLVPIAAFSIVDGYLLWAERRFRTLFDLVRESDSAVAPFMMAATGDDFVDNARLADHSATSRPVTMLRPTLALFYLGLAIAAVVGGILVG
jgi:hypothetical protein